MRSSRSVLVSVCAASALVMGAVAAPAYAADPPSGFAAEGVSPEAPPQDGARTKTGQLAESDAALLARTDGAVVPVMVKVDVDPVASYTGDLDGYAATSPSVTGKELSLTDAAVEKYLAYVEGVLAETQAAITAAVPSAKGLSTYAVAYGGLAMTVKAADAKAILGVAGVAAVQDNSLRHLPTSERGSLAASASAVGASGAAVAADGDTIDNDASTFIGADAVWPSLGGRDLAGQGVIVGVIDSGIWPEHPMLVDNGIPRPAGGPWECDFGDGGDPAFTCNDKLVGAYAFLDTYVALNDVGEEDFCSDGECSARDSDGHGTHTATTAAGSYVESAPVFGVERGPVSGIAPGASIIAYRALGPGGGYTSDLLAAVQQTIIDGVDVINYSVSGSASVYSDAVELAFLDAYAAGIAVNASAGNDGPGASTANHAGPWVTTVAASTYDRQFASTLTLTSSDGATFTKQGSTLTQGVTDTPVVWAANVVGYAGGARCLEPFPEGSVEGLVVICERGENGRVEKGYNALQGGAAGMVLYNPTASDVETDNHFLPTIHLEGPNDELLAFLGSHPEITATWAEGQATAAQGDVMAGFSSRGPIGEFLKPDVTAPGVQILAGHTPESTDTATGPQGELYQAIAGTSMSSPHAAGVSALVIAAHPDWTPGQVKSALMTSSVQGVVNADGSPAGVFDRGAGSIRADRAIAPVLTVSETADRFAASAADPLGRNDLNIPSVLIDPLPGAVIVTRTVKNVTGSPQTFSVSSSIDGGVSAYVSPSSFTLAAGHSKKLTILITGIGAEDGWHEGQLTLTPKKGGNAVVIPVAVNVGEASLSLAQSCDPTEIKWLGTSTCTVTASSSLPVDVQATIDVLANPLLNVTKVTAPAKKHAVGATWKGTLTAALPPTIDAIDAVDPDETVSGGYLPLSAFGITPVAGVGDESIVNFTVPSFVYGGEVYDRIGVVSNGYVVIGGGTAGDVEYEPPASFPDAATPNNVIAPFWTDLNPADGGGIRVGTLVDDEGTQYLVVDWEDIHAWSGGAGNSFQVWIQLGATENTWMAYGSDLTPDTASGWLVGAENRDGTSGINLTEVDTDAAYVVRTSPPTAGGVVSFTYTVRGLLKGTWSTAAALRSDAIDTVPIEITEIRVK